MEAAVSCRMEIETHNLKKLIGDLEVSLAAPEPIDPQEFRKTIVHILKGILDQTDALERKVGRMESQVASVRSGL